MAERTHWWRRWPGILLRWTLLIPLLVYTIYAGFLWAKQDAFMFPAPEIAQDQLDAWAGRVGATPLRIPLSGGGHVAAWQLRSEGPRRGVVAFFHGNGGSVTASPALLRVLPDGWDVVGFSYPGYPGGSGSPSEAGFQQTAEAAWTQLTGPLGYEPDEIVVHGHSMGGSVAAMVASEHPVAGLVLESTFLSMQQVAADKHPLAPVSLLIAHPLRTDLRLPRVKAPVLVMHSTDDGLIGVAHGRGLAAIASAAEYVERAGYAHGNWLVLEDDVARGAYVRFVERQSTSRGSTGD